MTAELAAAGPAPGHDPLRFYIPITSTLSERRPRVLKDGDTFGLFDHNGDIVGGDGNPEGLYHRDTRYVSQCRLSLNGCPPLLLGSAVKDDNTLLTADLTNPDLFVDGRLVQARDTIHVARARFLRQGCWYERLAVRNFDHCRREVTVEIAFACDFADIFEVRGARRAARGTLTVEAAGAGALRFTYVGLDRIARRALFRFDPLPAQLDGTRARFVLSLEPMAATSLFLTIGVDDSAPHRSFLPCLREARRAQRTARVRAALVTTSNAVLNEVLRRSTADLRMLLTDTPCGPYPYAGIPWFSTAFGRDGLLTALQMLWADPSMARGVLRFLAATQASASDPAADAQPGKILHEMRCGEMAELGEVPFRRYYGSVDSTPLFVLLAGAYLERTGDLTTIRALWPNLLAALDWLDRFGDRDGDDLIEYHRESPGGLVNQGWKDAADAVFHADGTLAQGPIALCEVQGYAWQARRAAARIARALDDVETAAVQERRAEALRERFESAFWCEELGTYALALDGAKRPCRVRSSNAGQVLLTGLAAPERARSVADQLLSRNMFSGWGIRTVASDEARYSPMSYHNGSVWPHDNALIALGLRRYGLVDHACRVFAGIFAAAAYMDLRRLPELFCGFRRRPGSGPTFYPVACSPQAWASAAPFALLQACLGIEFEPAAGVVWFRRPRLPDFLDEVRIRGLSLPQGRLDVVLHRYGEDVSVNVVAREGPVSAAVAL